MEPGKIYFYTATILNWQVIMLGDKVKDKLMDSLCFLVKEGGIRLYGFVIMPNHIHLIWKPLESSRFKNLQLSFMRFTGQALKFHLSENEPDTLKKFKVLSSDREYQIWQRNPLPIELYTRSVLEQKLTYIHNNPVQEKWKLVSDPVDYRYSSASFYENGTSVYSGILTHYMDDI